MAHLLVAALVRVPLKPESQRDSVSKPRVASLRATLGTRQPEVPTPTGLRPEGFSLLQLPRSLTRLPGAHENVVCSFDPTSFPRYFSNDVAMSAPKPQLPPDAPPVQLGNERLILARAVLPGAAAPPQNSGELFGPLGPLRPFRPLKFANRFCRGPLPPPLPPTQN
jgi:hypothetical protein